jgi:predicted aspartyl protease
MTSGVGRFNSLGSPCLKFHLCGVAHDPPGLEFEGIIDTGFNGFIQLPMQHAFSLKLPLEGTSSYILADGSRGTSLTALARTTVGDKSLMGVVILAPGAEDILVGMAFLRQFKLGILMTTGLIVLLDEDEVQRFSESERGKGDRRE